MNESPSTPNLKTGTPSFRVGTHNRLDHVPNGKTKAIRKKQKAAMCSQAANGIVSVPMTLHSLGDWTGTEHGIVSNMSDGHRCNESASASFLVADDDVIGDAFVANAIAFNQRTGYGLIVGGTATEGHYRAIVPFVDGEITDPAIYGLAFQWFARELGGEIDPASEVISQLWLGFRRGTQQVLDGKMLTLDEIMQFIAPDIERLAREEAERQRRRAEQEYKPIEKGSEDAQKSVTRVLDHAYNALASLRENSNRKKAANGQARWLASFLAYYPITQADIEKTILAACEKNGATDAYGIDGSQGVLDPITRGIDAGLLDPPEPLEAPTKKTHKPKRSVRQRIEKQAKQAATHGGVIADHTIHERLITALPAGVTSAAVQSGVGTFKTGLGVQEMGRTDGHAMYVTHTKELAGQFASRAAQQNVIVELYSEMLKRDLYRAPRLSACINTLVLYVKSTGEMPPAPDLLILDEWSQFVEQFLIGGTLEKDELHICDQVMRHLLSKSGRVLVMDAHLSAAALAYLHSARPGTPVVVNTYKTPRGNLHLCEKRGRAVGEFMAAVMAGKRAACASFSVDQGQAIADQAAAAIGDPELTIFIHAGNRGEARQAAFLRDPNTEAKKYRAVIYSPVIGTGYSIDPPVDVLVALGNNQQSAEDVRQFIGRYRNVTDTYVWLPDNKDVRESDAQAIAEREVAAAERSAHPYVLDGRLQRSISDQARQYVQHHAAVLAERNGSQNHLRDRFIALCAGSYTLHALDGDDPATTAAINTRRAEIDEHRREMALTAPRIDRDTFKRKQDAGLVSDLDHAGHTAWQIESLTGCTLSEALRDRLWTEARRKQASRHADLLDSIEALALADLEEAAFDDPLHKRKHRIERRRITDAFLRPLVNADQLSEYSAADLERVYRPIIEHHAEGLRLYFGWYAYRTNTAPGILRLVLRRLGLTLSGARRRVKGEDNPVQFYQVDADRYHAAVDTARAIVAQREADRMEAYEQQIALPVRKLQNTPISPSVAESVHRTTDPPTGWAAAPDEFAERIAWLTAPIGAYT